MSEIYLSSTLSLNLGSRFIGFGIILSGYNFRDFKLHNI